jgi:hypothetical protein
MKHGVAHFEAHFDNLWAFWPFSKLIWGAQGTQTNIFQFLCVVLVVVY